MNQTYGTNHDRRLRTGDWIILVLAVLICLGAIGYYLYSEREAPAVHEISCVFLISAVERSAWESGGADRIAVGDRLRSENGTVVLGTVEKIEPKEHVRATVRKGKPMWESHPYLIDLEITVRMQVTERAGDGLRAGDLRMAAGGKGNYRFGQYLTSAELVALEESVS